MTTESAVMGQPTSELWDKKTGGKMAVTTPKTGH